MHKARMISRAEGGEEDTETRQMLSAKYSLQLTQSVSQTEILAWDIYRAVIISAAYFVAVRRTGFVGCGGKEDGCKWAKSNEYFNLT